MDGSKTGNRQSHSLSHMFLKCNKKVQATEASASAMRLLLRHNDESAPCTLRFKFIYIYYHNYGLLYLTVVYPFQTENPGYASVYIVI